MTLEFLTKEQAAKMMGVCYEKFRRDRAKGLLGDLRVYQPTPTSRELIYKDSVLDFIRNRSHRCE